jgi:outer membrane receptor protein involved in Fe transport
MSKAQKSFLVILTVAFYAFSNGQAATIRGKVTASDFPEGLKDVNVTLYQNDAATRWGAATGDHGEYLIEFIPAGSYKVHFDYVGYQSAVHEVVLNDTSDITINVMLSPEVVTEQPVEVVTSSLSKHEVSVSNTPMRVEVMVPEEVQDKIAFSTSVDGALRYSGGIVINASKNIYEAENIRLRGVDSRYLLLLDDRVQVLGYQPDEVGIWTLPLVGIKQLEVVKGDYAALYGYGNAGVINTVRRTPFSDSLAFFGLARSDFADNHYAGFYAGRKWGKWGASGVLSEEALYAEPDGSIKRYVISPRLDYQNGDMKGFLTGSLLGSILDGSENLFARAGFSAGLETPFSDKSKLMLNAQYADQTTGYFPAPDDFKANDDFHYGSAQWIRSDDKLTAIVGLDGYGETWDMPSEAGDMRTEINRTGALLQLEWTPDERWSLLYGGRFSQAKIQSKGAYGYYTYVDSVENGDASFTTTEVNQMLSLLWKPGYFVSYRLTGSYGTAPLLSHYLSSQSADPQLLVPSATPDEERFVSANFDLKLKHNIGPVWWTGNLSFFFIKMLDHLDVYDSPSDEGLIELRNGPDYTIKGAEVFSRLDFGDDLALLVGYTFLSPDDQYENSPGTLLPLPRHQANFEIDWDIESSGFRMEIESKLVGEQRTPGNPYRSAAPLYNIWGGTLEYRFSKVKIFAGSENITDFVQSDPGPLWGPREGREFYLGIKSWF